MKCGLGRERNVCIFLSFWFCRKININKSFVRKKEKKEKDWRNSIDSRIIFWEAKKNWRGWCQGPQSWNFFFLKSQKSFFQDLSQFFFLKKCFFFICCCSFYWLNFRLITFSFIFCLSKEDAVCHVSHNNGKSKCVYLVHFFTK